MPSRPTLEEDLRVIEAINERDVQYAKANDPAMMMSQWTDDFVVLPPVGPIMRGRAEIAEAIAGMENPMETVDWALNFEEVKIFGDYALQWGTYGGTLRPRVGGEQIRTGGKLMRILQRQPDGSWKMYRTMYTVDQPTP
jgi:uncharacterized protein (TIGR02246 family)